MTDIQAAEVCQVESVVTEFGGGVCSGKEGVRHSSYGKDIG